MNIIPYKQKTRPPSYRRPVSTAKAEGLQAQARKYQHRAGMISAIGGITANLANVANKILDYQEANDLMNAETEFNRRTKEFLVTLRDPNNPVSYSEYGERWESEKTSIHEDILETLKLPRSRKEFERRYERMADNFGFEVQNEAWKLQINQMQADTDNNIEIAIGDNDFAKVKEYLSAASNYVYTPTEATKKLADAESRIAYNIASAAVDSFGAVEQGIKYLDSDKMNKVLEAKGINPGALTVKMRKEMKATKRADWHFNQALETERFQDANMKQMEEAQRLAYTGEVTVGMLDSGEIDKIFPDITAPQKRVLRSIIESKIEEIETGKTPKTDPALEVELGLMFADEDVSNWELNEFVEGHLEPDKEGKYITYDDYQSFLTDMKTRRPEPAVIGGLKMFDDARRNDKISFEEEAQLQNMLHSERLKKDYSPNEILEIAENLLGWMEKPNTLKRIKKDIDKAVEGKPKAVKKVEKKEEAGELLGIEQTGVKLPEEEPEEEKPDMEKIFIETSGRKPTKTQVFTDDATGIEYTVFTDKKGYWRYWNGKWQRYNKRKEEWQDKKP